jgi:hypothetical protein
MWFGTRAYMQEVPDPDIDPDFSSVGWSQPTSYLNGGLGVSASTNSHHEYYLSWTAISAAEGRQVTDYADGVYGSGLIYWLDPIAARSNVLPQSWATPSIGGYDGVPLAGDVRPTLSTNSVTSQGYPAELATYTLTEDSVLRSVFVPIPAGYVAWVGVHGAGDAQDMVKVTPYTGSTAGTVVYPTILSTATTTRVNTEIEGTGLELSLDNTTPGTFTLAGMIVQVLPDGVTPETGGFISGQGHSGCRFIGKPTRAAFKVGSPDQVSITAKLGEVGEWE